MIGKDRSTGQVRSWSFDEEGSFGESTWSRDGRKWVQDAFAVVEDGSIVAINEHILTWIDNDTFTFQSVQAHRGTANAVPRHRTNSGVTP